MIISVVGLGYLGAVHAAAMAELGHDVIGLDIDEARVASLRAGIAPFHEPGFEDLLQRALAAGRLRVTTDYADLAEARMHFLALGTPQRPDSSGADLSILHAAVESLAAVLEQGRGAPVTVVGKSTVPPGTARALALWLRRSGPVTLVWNPEFLREGFAVGDTLHPDRLVYGLEDPLRPGAGAAALDEVYAPILDRDVPRLLMGYEDAELVKVSANAFLAPKISFINAIAEVCEQVGADVTEVARALGMDERIGSMFLRAGVGFGGGCLPKDIRAFRASARELGAGEALAFLDEVDAVNQRRRDRVVDLAADLLGTLEGRRITVLGATFKPDSDDVRDSPALDVAARLHAAGASVRVTDPQGLPGARRRLPDLETCADTQEALRGAELVLLLTEWEEYRRLDPEEAGRLVARRLILDGRAVLDPGEWTQAGWEIHALGRPARRPAPRRTDAPRPELRLPDAAVAAASPSARRRPAVPLAR